MTEAGRRLPDKRSSGYWLGRALVLRVGDLRASALMVTRAIFASILPAIVVSQSGFAQTPTPAQLELLNSLPPAQRQQLLQQIQQQQGQVITEPQLEFPETVIQPSLEDPELNERILEALGQPPRLQIGSTIVVSINPRGNRLELLSGADRTQQQMFGDRLAASNPYRLDAEGNLNLPGVPAIPLAGLSAEQATVRINAEASLTNFAVEVTLLPLEPVGVAALKPFGYDLFDGVPTTFAPATDVPVPAEYVMGPGDTLRVQLFGNENVDYALVVSRDGAINLPDIGPINIGGLTFDEARNAVTQRINEQMIGVQSSITIGELRSIRVFVLGDVARPGSYTVSGLSTMTNALFVSGGVEEIGTLRRIDLKRDGATVATLDLYDLLLRGDTSDDARLLPGDAIFVPPIGDTVVVDGSVRRPAIYELNGESTVAEVIEIAGGLRPTADATTVKIERVVPGRGMSVRDIDLSTVVGGAEMVRDGDVVRVPPNLEMLEDAIRLVGNAQQPGLYQWREGLTLVDLIPSAERLKPLSDLNYILIRRETDPNVSIQAISADLQAAWRQPGGPENLDLEPRDTVYVFNLEIGRGHIVAPLLEELRARAPPRQEVEIVRVGGEVRAPGEYPLEPGMRLTDLIRAGGGLAESAYALDAELTRYEVADRESRRIEIRNVDLAAALNGDESADLLVSAHDYFNVRRIPQWLDQETVQLVGEFRFPGIYPIRKGEPLTSVLDRAGGFTEHAFLNGSVFLRAELREREREQLESLAGRIRTDLATLAISDQGSPELAAMGQSLVEQLSAVEPVGRLVIDLENIAVRGGQDVVMKDGDQLYVPDTTQSVTVLGEVQYPTSHLFNPALSRDGYLDLSGGLTNRADRRRIYLVRANGEVVTAGRSAWFSRSQGGVVEPGDTIIVPIDVFAGRRLSFWASATQILYNIAIAITAVDSFGN